MPVNRTPQQLAIILASGLAREEILANTNTIWPLRRIEKSEAAEALLLQRSICSNIIFTKSLFTTVTNTWPSLTFYKKNLAAAGLQKTNSQIRIYRFPTLQLWAWLKVKIVNIISLEMRNRHKNIIIFMSPDSPQPYQLLSNSLLLTCKQAAIFLPLENQRHYHFFFLYLNSEY